jgi:hypothetical protein
MSDPAIQTNHLTRYFGNKCVVNDLNLSVPRGSILGFLSRNGSGKNALRMILGYSRQAGEAARFLATTAAIFRQRFAPVRLGAGILSRRCKTRARKLSRGEFEIPMVISAAPQRGRDGLPGSACAEAAAHRFRPCTEWKSSSRSMRFNQPAELKRSNELISMAN